MGSTRRLSSWLVFCIVYADIGTSVFYVPGILYGNPTGAFGEAPHGIGQFATLAQILTLGVFILIARKYADICARCPDGGGVVSIAEQAFPSMPTLALVGGAMITIDYFLTSAISGVSGIYYLQSLIGFDRSLVVPVTIGCLGALIYLNIVGLKESASVTAVMSVVMIIVNAILIGLSAVRISAQGAWGQLWGEIVHPDVPLSASTVLIGYANTWLAYSGLESAAQVSGAMSDPTRKTASKAMWGVIAAIAFISPSLTAFSIKLLPEEVKVHEPEAFISHLAVIDAGGAVSVTHSEVDAGGASTITVIDAGGKWLQILTVISATLLLIMACNTALVGNYHVNSRLTSAGFLPRVLAKRHRKYGTPYISIAISAAVPMIVLLGTRGNVDALGDLYSFGLLGTLVISSISIDRLRWREQTSPFEFLAGSLTTIALLLAWGINLFHKPNALIFGGGLTAIMVALGTSYRRGWIPAVKASAPAAVSWKDAERAAGAAPEAAKVLTLEEAIDLKPLESSSVLIALRGFNETLIEDAAYLAKGRGERSVYVVVCDEVPGLYIPHDVTPSEDAQALLTRSYDLLQRRFQLLALPIWRLSSDASSAIAEAATDLGVKAVVVGTTKRGAIWHLLRGNVLKGLLKRLPADTRLVISS